MYPKLHTKTNKTNSKIDQAHTTTPHKDWFKNNQIKFSYIVCIKQGMALENRTLTVFPS